MDAIAKARGYLSLLYIAIDNDTTQDLMSVIKSLVDIIDGMDIEQKTLRDEMAMAALSGMLGHPETNGFYDDFARHAYAYADAMMEARKK